MDWGNDEVRTNKRPPQQAEQRETTPPNSFNQELKEFASGTSFGGISKVTLSDGYIRRFVWLLISGTCYGFAIMYCFALVNIFLKKPIKTTVDISYSQVILCIQFMLAIRPMLFCSSQIFAHLYMYQRFCN